MCHPGRWATVERDIWYLRELAVLKGVHYDVRKAQSPTDPDEVSVPNPRGKNLNRLLWTDPVLEHLQYTDDTIVGSTAAEVLEKRKKIFHISLKAVIK